MRTRAKPSWEEMAPLKEVFEDSKKVVHAKTVGAQPPRCMSEKTRGGLVGHTSMMRAASPELRDQVGERQAAATVVGGSGGAGGGGDGRWRGVPVGG